MVFKQFMQSSVAALAAGYITVARKTLRRAVGGPGDLAVDAVLFDASRVSCQESEVGIRGRSL
eukprot:8066539-Alexandrium_andersonii.AAC.1